MSKKQPRSTSVDRKPKFRRDDVRSQLQGDGPWTLRLRQDRYAVLDDQYDRLVGPLWWPAPKQADHLVRIVEVTIGKFHDAGRLDDDDPRDSEPIYWDEVDELIAAGNQAIVLRSDGDWELWVAQGVELSTVDAGPAIGDPVPKDMLCVGGHWSEDVKPPAVEYVGDYTLRVDADNPPRPLCAMHAQAWHENMAASERQSRREAWVKSKASGQLTSHEKLLAAQILGNSRAGERARHAADQKDAIDVLRASSSGRLVMSPDSPHPEHPGAAELLAFVGTGYNPARERGVWIETHDLRCGYLTWVELAVWIRLDIAPKADKAAPALEAVS